MKRLFLALALALCSGAALAVINLNTATKDELVVYDVDQLQDEAIITELMSAGTYQSFGPDTLAEARNRGFKLYKGNGAG